MDRMSTLPDRSFRVSFQINSEPYVHGFQVCTGTPPEPPKDAAASVPQAPLRAKSCWIMTS